MKRSDKILISLGVILFFCSIHKVSQHDGENFFLSHPVAAGEEHSSMEDQGHISDRPEIKKFKKGPQQINKSYIQVRLLAINDLHGQLNVTRRVAGRPSGRVDYLAAYLKQRAAQTKNTIFLHIGDMVGASAPVSSLLQDEPTIELLNDLGFDIGTFGNHEFDRGIIELKRLINGGEDGKKGRFAGANFPWIAANVVEETTDEPVFPPYEILEVDGIPVGFIGVVNSKTPSVVSASGILGIKFMDEVESVNRYVQEIKNKGVRSIIVLAHNPGSSGIDGENASGELVKIAHGVDAEVDVVYGAHNHAYMNAIIDGKLLVQSYSFGTAFSDVELQIDPRTKDIVSKRAEIVTVFQDEMNPDPEMTQVLKKYESIIEPIVNQVIGSTSCRLTTKQNNRGESVLGDLIADSQRKAMNTDFSFVNPGGIRADIEKGEIRWGDLYTVQPFNNHLVKMTMTGQQILDVLNQQWSENPTMLQISGFSYVWDEEKPNGQKVMDIRLSDGTNIDLNKRYSVTTNSFLAGGGDGFTVFTEAKEKQIGANDLTALIEFIREQSKPFTYKIHNRIKMKTDHK